MRISITAAALSLSLYVMQAGTDVEPGAAHRSDSTLAESLIGSNTGSTLPTPVSATPNSGAGTTQNFTLVYSDPNGAANLYQAGVIFASAATPVGSCYAYYRPATNGLYLENDAGSGLTGPLPPTSSASLSNSQCTVSWAGLNQVPVTGTNLTLNLAITFSSSYVGVKTIYMRAMESSAVTSGWLNMGSWTLGPTGPPTAISVSPNSGTGLSQNFQLAYSDPRGAAKLYLAGVIFGSSATPVRSCYAYYLPGANALYLENDAGTGVIGSLAPTSSASLSNSQCTVSWSGLNQVPVSGTKLTLNLSITFNASYVGLKNIYLRAMESSSVTSGWVNLGSWTPVSPIRALLTAPVDGATNVPGGNLFTWNAVSGAIAYYLYVGTSLGSKDVVDTGEIQQTSYPATLPGNTHLYARLWTKSTAGWLYSDISFTTLAQAVFLAPLNGASNLTSPYTFRWNTVSGAQTYYLYVGTAPGLKDIVDSAGTLATSFQVSALPGGTKLYGRIFTELNGVWKYSDVAFSVGSKAIFTYPVNNATSIDTSRPISWTTVGGAQAYELSIGTSQGANDILDSGQILKTSYVATIMPPGKTLWARISTQLGGTWQYSDITFITSPVAALTYPRNGQVDVGTPTTLQWSSVPNVQYYYVYVGSKPGAKDLIDSGGLQHTSYDAALPKATRVYCRLFTEVGGIWRYHDSAFETAPFTTNAGTGEWAYPRKDALNSGFQDLPGRIIHPAVVARYYIGGNIDYALAADVDNDGRTEFVTTEGGAVVVRSGNLATKWVSPAAGVVDIIGIYDLAGNGTRVIVAISPMTIYALSGVNGAILWSQTTATSINRAALKVASLRPDLPGLQIFLWPDYATIGIAYAFDKGVASGYQLWQTPEIPETRSYPPEVTIGDVNGDGHPKIVIATYGKIMTFDGATGSNQFSGWNGEVDWISGPGVNGRNYGTLSLVPLDNTGRLGMVLISDSVTQHIAVVTNSATGLSLLWDKFVAYTYTNNTKNVHSTIHSVSSFFGDGRIDIAVSLFNDTGDNRWHLLVYDALTGSSQPLLDLPDRYLWGVQDLGGDGGIELLASVEPQRSVAAAGTIEIYSAHSGGFNLVWSAASSAFAIDPHSAVPPRTSSYSLNGVQEILRADVLGSGRPLFFSTNSGVLTGYTYTVGTVAAAWTGDGNKIVSAGKFDNSATAVVLTCSPLGTLTISDATGTLGTAQAGGLEGVPLVADLDGDGRREILLSAYGQVRVLDITSGVVTERWRTAGLGLRTENDLVNPLRTHRVQSPYLLPAFDIDGSGRKEILMTDTDASTGHARLHLLNGDGSERWSHIFTDLPPDDPDSGVFQWAAGKFDATGSVDLYVAGQLGGFNTEVSRVLNGTSGQLLYAQDALNGDGFAPGYGYSAVDDINGDGIDDIVFQAKNYAYDLDGVSSLSTVFGPSTGLYYHTPVVTDIDGQGNRALLFSAGFEDIALVGLDGTNLWRNTTLPWDLFSRQPGIAAVNGDGVQHIAVSHTNGVLECFDGVAGVSEWTWPIDSVATNIASDDIAGSGAIDFVFGTLDGRVIAVNGQASAPQRVLWTVNIGRSVGDVIIADALGTGHSQVLAVAGDGYLYILDEAPADSP